MNLNAKLRVWAVPGPNLDTKNPYIRLLYQSVERASNTQVEDRFRLGFMGRADVLHIHWPELFLNKSGLAHMLAKLIKLLLQVIWIKCIGGKLVWTAHNLKPHENRWPRLAGWFERIFPSLCDGIIFLSDETMQTALRRWRGLSARRVLIPHGPYEAQAFAQSSKDALRKLLGLAHQDLVFCCFGMIRRYKNVPALIREFVKVADDDWTLVVAGEVINDAHLEDEIKAIDFQGKKVILKLTRQSDDDLERLCRASDFVVLPYADIANSGSLLYALSVGTRVIAPQRGAIPEVAAQCGTDWVKTYVPPFSAVVLQSAKDEDVPTAPPNLDWCNWQLIGTKTSDFYKQVVR